MKVVIDSKVLEEDGFTMQDFSIILYYFSGGSGTLNEELCEKLREYGFLKRVPDGYQFHEGKNSKMKTWKMKSEGGPKGVDRLIAIAKAMQEEFPEGKKSGTTHYWRDSAKVIAQRLSRFIEKYGDYPDEDFAKAAKNYVESFNGNYSFMQVLRYFIYKRDTKTGDEVSQLASFLDNADQQSLKDKDWTSNLV